MPFTYPQRGSRCLVPSSLTRRFRLEALEETGRWRVIFREGENYQRLVHVPLDVCAKGLRLVAEETWGDDAVRLFAFEPSERYEGKRPAVPDGPHFSEVRAKIAPKDLLPPENGLKPYRNRVGAPDSACASNLACRCTDPRLLRGCFGPRPSTQ